MEKIEITRRRVLENDQLSTKEKEVFFYLLFEAQDKRPITKLSELIDFYDDFVVVRSSNVKKNSIVTALKLITGLELCSYENEASAREYISKHMLGF
jgi:hypothetical protein